MPPLEVVVVYAEMLIVRSSTTEMLESETNKVRKVFIEVVNNVVMIQKTRVIEKRF